MHRRFALGLLLLVPGSLAAQARDTTPVPRELAFALLRFAESGGGNPQIIVGGLPSRFPRRLVPAGATILGALEYADVDRRPPYMRGNLVILRTPARPDSTMTAVRAHLDRQGWRVPPHRSGIGRGGFTPSSSEDARRVFLCRDSETLLTTVVDRPEGGSFVRIAHNRDNRTTVCDERQQRMMAERTGPAVIELPVLRLPAGAKGGATGGGGGMYDRETRARIETTLSPADLVEHFAAQLKDDGWTLGTRLGEGNVAVQSARKPDATGGMQQGVLLVTRLDSGQHDAIFRVILPTRTRR